MTRMRLLEQPGAVRTAGMAVTWTRSPKRRVSYSGYAVLATS